MRDAPADSVITTPIWAMKSANSSQRWVARRPTQSLLATKNATRAVIARPAAIQPYTPRRKAPTRASAVTGLIPRPARESSRAMGPSIRKASRDRTPSAAGPKPRGAGSGRPPPQAVLPHAPDQELDPVLAEERLAGKDHRRDAPVPGRFECALVLRDDVVVSSGIPRDRGIQLREIEAGPLRRVGEVRALVPAVHVSAPYDT